MSGYYIHLISKDNDIIFNIDPKHRISSLNDDNLNDNKLYFTRLPSIEEMRSENKKYCIDLFICIFILSHYIERTDNNFYILVIDKKLNNNFKNHIIKGEYYLKDYILKKKDYDEITLDNYYRLLNSRLEQLEGDLSINNKLMLALEKYTAETICKDFNKFLDYLVKKGYYN